VTTLMDVSSPWAITAIKVSSRSRSPATPQCYGSG
jgi:hypothetical protein